MNLYPIKIAFLFCSVSFLITSCGENKAKTPAAGNTPRGAAPVQAEAFIVKTRSLSENIEVSGTLLPFETTQIRPEISGRIVSLNIPEGRYVTKGTVLAKLFDADLQAQLRKLQVQLSIAEKTAERYNELLKIQGISQQEYDLSVLQVNNLKADIQLVQVDIARTRIVAPFNGQIGLRTASVGAYITPADILTTISQVNTLKLQFTVPEKYSEEMTNGKEVLFRINGVSQRFTARVMATETLIEANTRSLKVLAVVSAKSKALTPGGFANVSLQLGKDADAIIVPSQAIIPGAREKRVILYRNNGPQFEVVTTGIRDSSFVQVLDGLKVGDTVLTTGLLAIRPESKVNLTKVE